MKSIIVALATASVLTAGIAQADAGKDLAAKSGCLGCHQIDGKDKMYGPNYKDIAAKYKGDKAAEAKLIAKVKVGGSGVWGKNMMIPNSPQVKDEDIKTLVQWVLAM